MIPIEKSFDPIPLEDPAVTKFSHHFKEGHRVTIKETGHRGKITHLDDHNRVHVQLDSGHFVQCRPDELEPEDFGSGAGKAVSKSNRGIDPIPV